MAAYASTVVKLNSKTSRGPRNLGTLVGTCDITNYNTTGAEITDITGAFGKLLTVTAGVSDNGYICRWDRTDNCFHAYYPDSTEATHTHAVALDSGASGAEAAHTHAIALDSGASAAGAAHTHVLTAQYEPDFAIAVKPTITLTHNADPATNLNALPLYAYEAQGQCAANTINLESTTNGNASIWGETADGTVGLTAASCRFLVADNNSPNGVQIYVNEGTGDRLEFISPTTTDGYIVMPFEGVAVAPGGYAVAVKVYHSATADSGVALTFDDNGAADAQLVFIDTGAAGGVVPAGDITVLVPNYMADAAGNLGSAANESTHTHASGSLADAASAAGSSHTHGSGTLADAASAAGGSETAGAAGEVANDVDVGEVNFVAYGYWHHTD